jgi:phosphonate degradation associated HDIG domain protein
MPTLSSLEDLERLYATQGALNYGEGVSQIEHALQCAALAQADGAAPSLVIAALLHDVGHLFEVEEDVARFEIDDHHQATGADALRDLFDEAICGPIALHVAAKRYLCHAEAGYHAALSPASQSSLRLQGGPFNAVQAAAFEHLPHWREAVALRRYDDTGKRDEAPSNAFADYTPMMRELLIGLGKA